MRIHPHATEYIQAEIDFAATDLTTRDYLAGCLVMESETLAKEESPTSITRTYTEEREGQQLAEPQTMSRATYEGLIRDIRALPYGRQALRCAAMARQRYQSFEPEIEDLQSYIEKGTAHELGSGNESAAYLFPKEGKRYVAAVAHDYAPSWIKGQVLDMPSLYGGPEAYAAFKTADRACTLACGYGIPDVQQLAAYSPQDRLCIAEYIPGRPIHQLTPEEIATITAEQIQAYGRAVHELASRNLVVDCGEEVNNPTNILWHPKHGFRIIDYRRAPVEPRHIEGACDVLWKGLLCAPESFGSVKGPTQCPEKVEAATPLFARSQSLLEYDADR